VHTLCLNAGEGPLHLVHIDPVYSIRLENHALRKNYFPGHVEPISVFADDVQLFSFSDFLANHVQEGHQEDYPILVVAPVTVPEVELRQELVDLD
jgi:hypothetical protein